MLGCRTTPSFHFRAANGIAGAIAILLETGDCEAAAQWGLAWLENNSRDLCVPDVAILTASAYCDQAGLLVEQSLENGLEAYQLLLRAKELMYQYDAGTDMMPDINDSIEVICWAIPQCVFRRTQHWCSEMAHAGSTGMRC